METSVYSVEAGVEETHWWFLGRRRLLHKLITDLAIPRDAAVLDVGSGTGSNLRLLRELGFGDVRGVDLSDEAIRHCQEKGLGLVRKGDICALPFEDDRFDLVLATDIIEHVDDDSAAIAEIGRVLRPAGSALVTVPAFQSLWGLQDDVSHHKRRYRRAQLVAALEAAGLRVRSSFYFNYILFAPIWLARQIIRIFRVRLESENQVNTRLVNRLLTAIFAFDVGTAPRIRPPFGVSILAVARGAGPTAAGDGAAG